MNNLPENDTFRLRGRTGDEGSTELEGPAEEEEEDELVETESETQDAGQSTGESDEFEDLPDLENHDDWMYIATFGEGYRELSVEEREDFRARWDPHWIISPTARTVEDNHTAETGTENEVNEGETDDGGLSPLEK